MCEKRLDRNNWLITQRIDRTVNGSRISRLYATIDLEQKCDGNLACRTNKNLYAYMYQTSHDDKHGARNIKNYVKIGTWFGNPNGIKQRKTIVIDFKNSHYTSFYFAIQDKGSCPTISNLFITYSLAQIASEGED